MDPFLVQCCLVYEPECPVNLLGPNCACKSLVMLLVAVRVAWLTFSEYVIVTLLKHISDFEVGAGIKSPAFESMNRSKISLMLRHIQGKRTLSNLPEDPPCLEGLTLQTVQTGDFRPGLVPGKDVTVHTTSAIAKGTVLGLYRNITVTKAEERVIRNNPPAEFPGSKNEWRQKLDAYIADVEQPARKSQSWRRFAYIYQKVLKVGLTCITAMLCKIAELQVVHECCAARLLFARYPAKHNLLPYAHLNCTFGTLACFVNSGTNQVLLECH